MAGKKGQREFGSIRKQTTKSARYQASFVGPDTRRHFAPVTFDSRLNAERWLAREKDLIEKAAITGDRWTAPAERKAEKKSGSVEYESVCYRLDQRTKLKPRTRIEYERLWANNCEKKLGRVAVRDVNPALIRSWYSGLDQSKATRNGHAYGLVHAILATAVRDGLLPSNPAMISGAMNPPTKKVVKDLTISEVHAIADKLASSERYQRFSAFVLISAWVGMRFGEAIELRRRDFDAECSVVSIARGVTRGSLKQGTQAWFLDTPKDGKAAKIVVPPHIREEIKDHLSKHVSESGDSLLFPALVSGKHLDNTVFNRDILKPVCEDLDLKGVTAHSLRHFAASRTAEVSSLAETKERLRHSTTKASERYQHAAKGSGAKVAERLSEVALSELNG